MKVLYFTNIPSPYKVDFLNCLNKTCEIFCVFNNNSKDDKRNESWYSNNFQFEYTFINTIDYFAIKNILNKHFDLAVVANYACANGAILMRMLEKKGIKYFIAADGGFKNEKDSLIIKHIRHYYISKANYYISSGKQTDEYFTYYGANPNNIFFSPVSSIHNVDILEKPISYEEKFIMRNDAGFNYNRLFISVGNFIPRKGYDLFLNSLLIDKHDDYGFLIIGGGQLKDKYCNFIKENGITNVHIIDYCDKDKIFNYLKMSDIFFFPSTEDIWGLVINEAMAVGLPIISSNKVNAALELIDNDYLYSPGNLIALANLIDYTGKLSNSNLESIGFDNIKRIKDHTIEKMVDAYISIFNKVME